MASPEQQTRSKQIGQGRLRGGFRSCKSKTINNDDGAPPRESPTKTEATKRMIGANGLFGNTKVDDCMETRMRLRLCGQYLRGLLGRSPRNFALSSPDGDKAGAVGEVELQDERFSARLVWLAENPRASPWHCDCDRWNRAPADPFFIYFFGTGAGSSAHSSFASGCVVVFPEMKSDDVRRMDGLADDFSLLLVP